MYNTPIYNAWCFCMVYGHTADTLADVLASFAIDYINASPPKVILFCLDQFKSVQRIQYMGYVAYEWKSSTVFITKSPTCSFVNKKISYHSMNSKSTSFFVKIHSHNALGSSSLRDVWTVSSNSKTHQGHRYNEFLVKWSLCVQASALSKTKVYDFLNVQENNFHVQINLKLHPLMNIHYAMVRRWQCHSNNQNYGTKS